MGKISKRGAIARPTPRFGTPTVRRRPARSTRPRDSGRASQSSAGALRCRRKFLRLFPDGFYDETYLAWERDYKWDAHERWMEVLDPSSYRSLLRKRDYAEIAALAIGVEARTHLIFSFEKMALRDAVRSAAGARDFAKGLYDFLYGTGPFATRFDRWCAVVAGLPRKQSRVSTWPIVTVFGFLAQPDRHIYFKPNVTRAAAHEYGFPLHYESRPSWRTYSSLLQFASTVQADLRELRPRDMIDIQSFLWVQGSAEYAE